MAEQWKRLAQVKNVAGQLQFKALSMAMMGILTIPHSNAACDRLFSQVSEMFNIFSNIWLK